MWVITTRVSASGSVPASKSLWAGLPPQSTRTAALSPAKTRDVVSRSRPGIAPAVPRKAKCTASGGGAGASQEQRDAHDRERHTNDAGQLRHPNGPEHERIGAEGLGDEPADGVEPDVSQEQGARRPFERVATETDEDNENEEVPRRLVEERRVKELNLGELDGAVRRRYVQPPRQIRGRAERLLVEEVAPPPNGLAQREARCGDIQVRDGRQPLPQRVAAAEQEAAQHTSVDGEPALPHGEDLGREPPVIVEIEKDVIEAGADEPAEETKLGGLEQAVWIYAAAPGLTVGQPQTDRHGARHQDAVPAEGEGAQLHDHGAGGVEHAASLIRPAPSPVK